MTTKMLITQCLLLLCTSLLLSQNIQTHDPKAKVILDALSKKTKSYASIKVDFNYTLTNKSAGLNETQKGSLLVKGNKYLLSMAGQKIISDGHTIWTYIEDADEVQINDVPEPGESDGELVDPTHIFTLYEKGFKYKFIKEENVNGKTVQWIDLFPEKAKEKSYHTIHLQIDKVKKQMISMEVVGKDGNHYTYQLKNFTPNVTADDKMFKFDVSKAGEVIDLR